MPSRRGSGAATQGLEVRSRHVNVHEAGAHEPGGFGDLPGLDRPPCLVRGHPHLIVTQAPPSALATASAIRSGLSGSSVRRTPTASWTALAMAAGAGTIGGSPTPRAPKGPAGDGTSTMMVSRLGRSAAVS